MSRRARLGAAARFGIAAVLLALVLFLAVFPTRTYLDQRESIADAQERLSVLREQNEKMRGRIRSLQTPEEIERIARQEFNLAKPGEEVYVIIPSPLEMLRRSGTHEEVMGVLRDAWGASAPAARAEDDAG